MSQNERKSAPARRNGGFMGGRMMIADKPKNTKKTIKRLIMELKPAWGRLLIVFLITIASTVVTIFIPKILATAINQLAAAFSGGYFEFSKLQSILIISVSLYLLSAVLQFISGFIMAGISQKTVFRMRKEISQKLTKLPLKYYDSHTYGEILSRITNDLDNISNSLSQSITQLISSTITVVGIFIVMLTINGWLTLIVVGSVPLFVGLITLVMKLSQKFHKSNQQHLGELNGHVEETYGGHKIIKAYGYESKSIAKFDNINLNLFVAGWKAQFFSGLMFPIMDFVGNIFYVLICGVGMIFVARAIGNLGIGEVIAFIQYAHQFQQPFAQLSRIVTMLQSTVASSERVFEIMDESEQIADKPDAKSLQTVRGSVVFENVCFGYSPENMLIQDMNIKIDPGQIVAIVGPTGAGKTTIVNLLMRFYEIASGSIKLDGVDIRDLSRNSLRKNIGMVLQDTWLFEGTISQNIAYGKPEASQDEIKAAAWTAQAHRFIKTLSDGYDTVLAEDASNISQGQRQLLTIARALLPNPPIIILDEATSSVDTITEIHIQKAMTELMKNRTCFVIAHRLSTIKNADLILVMENGSIVEQGNHDQLMTKGGAYCKLYNSQFDQA